MAFATLFIPMPAARLIPIATRVILALVLLLIAASIVTALVRTAPQLEVSPSSRLLPAVVVMEARPVPVQRRTVGYGVADALQHADVPARVGATVASIPPTTRVGQEVRAGELLVQLDDTDFKRFVERAEQAVLQAIADQELLAIERRAAEERADIARRDRELAEADLARVQDAFDQGAARQREVDNASGQVNARRGSEVDADEAATRFPSREEQLAATLATRQSDLAGARDDLVRCSVTSPIDGWLQKVDVRVGENLAPGQRVARVVNTRRLEIPLRLPSHARPWISTGDDVQLQSAGFGRRTWDARVTRIAPEDDTTSRTMIAYVDVEQEGDNSGLIPPGLFVRGDVRSAGPGRDRWVVPRRAVRDDRLLIVRDGVVHSVAVTVDFTMRGSLPKLGLPDRSWAVLETPLREGDLVIVDPSRTLRDGMEVRAIDVEASLSAGSGDE